IAATTGNDPALDALILRIHTETACRRGGALALRPQDLDTDQCLIFLREKGEAVRWQPISPTLMRHLQQHAHDRHAPKDGQLLRYKRGNPITTLTWVERNFGYAIARAYAGHTYSTGDAGTTTTYVRATIQEIATALVALTGEPHPLA
ncbi:site-specific integrase, partial [Kibdelosporangium lantanae]